MNARDLENEIFLHIEQPLRECCRWRWSAVEMEDRIAEARYVFLVVLRTRGIPEEEMWGIFKETLHEHMRLINRREGQNKRPRSLNAPMRCHNGEMGSSLLDITPSPAQDSSFSHVERFLARLSEPEQAVCTQLLLDPSRRRAARRLKMPLREVNRIHASIAGQYSVFSQHEQA